VRGAGDGDFIVAELRAGPHERKRLERLGERAHEGHERRVAGRVHDPALPDSDCVHAVARLRDLSAA
jgi:hypothetical protein